MAKKKAAKQKATKKASKPSKSKVPKKKPVKAKAPRAKKGDEGEFDPWSEFRDEEVEPIGIVELGKLPLAEMPDDARVRVMDDYFPDASIKREGDVLVCEIEDHMYTKFWEHKFSAYAFSRAMERAVRRMIHEGAPVSNPTVDDEDVHIFMRFELRLPIATPPDEVASIINKTHDHVCARADMMLENSDSVLVLGKDTGPSMDLLKRIASRLDDLGYYTYIIKDQPDKLGEGVIQKVMRYALTSKFIIVENTEPSGHLYEIPHIAKAAECVTAFLQEEGKGATWMFEDGYAKHPHWQKFTYTPDHLEDVVDTAAQWAENFIKQFGAYQQRVLPWMKPAGP